MDSSIIQYALRSKESDLCAPSNCRDYFYRLDELLKAFDEISKRTRFSTSDEDESAEARKRAKRQEKAARKKAKLEETNIVEL